MVQGSLDSKKFDLRDTHNIDNKILGFCMSRELSFSRWCDEDSRVHLDQQLSNADASREEARDSDFELPFIDTDQLQIRYQHKGMHMNGVGTMGDDTVYLNGNGSEKYVPLDIENGAARQKVGDSTVSLARHGSLRGSSANLVSAADILKTLFFILLWYTFSLFLTLYNKSLLGDTMGKFPAPFLMNTIHFAMQAVFSNFITWFWSHRFQTSVSMSWRDYLWRVVPTALGTALDINLSNASLVFISVTFATMCKSAAPIFLLLFAFAFRLETPSFKLSGIILVISIGILLTVAKETEFEFWGFVLVMLAAVMSGFRWCMTQILLQKEAYGIKNPLTLMSYVTPVMAGATALLSLALDPWGEFRQNEYFNSPWHITQSCLLMLLGGALAFLMVLTEYVLVSVTSAVTVTIAGVVKEAVTILVAVLYFHDQFTWLKGLGLFTIIVGVSLFNWYKYWKLQKGEAGEEHVGGTFKTDSATKYVILDEMDEQEESS
ncbi:probable sugar phosphate/phosphate translocator At1g06470 isoform X1 [Neltuma alba]|uniref:probable sugar phosphate/phosphate translocator At1g06470 isoform X1 n=1 Tax=Neltuma alba TaxID=207710 RepID=UPI0010A41268|nr:probable sugar phosphate/phosphate translocator At1g06470 isoform X1 [Prosopis alba]XP_028797994.1 probable sugar phosphate/phosphate translocator At1g06470 isoform X1 [Prosopis alba]